MISGSTDVLIPTAQDGIWGAKYSPDGSKLAIEVTGGVNGIFNNEIIMTEPDGSNQGVVAPRSPEDDHEYPNWYHTPYGDVFSGQHRINGKIEQIRLVAAENESLVDCP